MNIEGVCHCGKISFTAEADPAKVMVCHCTDCQVMSSAPYRAVVPVPATSFVMTGEPKHYIKTAESGNKRVQAFCPDCGTPLYASATEHVEVINVRLGCVKQRAELVPKGQVWTRSAMPWIGDLANVPAKP